MQRRHSASATGRPPLWRAHTSAQPLNIQRVDSIGRPVLPTDLNFEYLQGGLRKKCRSSSANLLRLSLRPHWKLRHFELVDDQLRWYSAKGAKLRGTQQLQGLTLTADLSESELLMHNVPGRAAGLCFRVHDGQGRPLYLRAWNEQEKTQWISKLSNNIYCATNPSRVSTPRGGDQAAAAACTTAAAAAAVGHEAAARLRSYSVGDTAAQPRPLAQAGSPTSPAESKGTDDQDVQGGADSAPSAVEPSSSAAEAGPPKYRSVSETSEPPDLGLTTWGSRKGNFPPPPPPRNPRGRARAATVAGDRRPRGSSIRHAFAPWMRSFGKRTSRATARAAEAGTSDQSADAPPSRNSSFAPASRESSFGTERADSKFSVRSETSTSEDDGSGLAGEASRSWLARRAYGVRRRAASVAGYSAAHISWSRRKQEAEPSPELPTADGGSASADTPAGGADADAASPRGGRRRMHSESV